jgi:hypothetical protein
MPPRSAAVSAHALPPSTGVPLHVPDVLVASHTVKLRRLAELSALVTLHRHHVIASESLRSDDSLHSYLQHARRRNTLWCKRLAAITLTEEPAALSESMAPFVAEVFVSEMLTRIWTAVLCIRDLRQGCVHASPVVRHVLVNVLELRLRLLQHLLNCAAPLGTLWQADRLRRRVERWIDLLIGELACEEDVLEFAVDPERAVEFRSQSLLLPRGLQPTAGELLLAGLQTSLPEVELHGETATAHVGIAEVIQATLPSQGHSQRGPRRLTVFPPHSQAKPLLPPGTEGAAGNEPSGKPADSPPRRGRSAGIVSLHEFLRRLSLNPPGPWDPPPLN